MTEVIPTIPENQVPVESFVKPDATEAIKEALYGDGVAIVENLGVSDDIRAGILDMIRNQETPASFDTGWNAGVEFYNDFDPLDIMPILDPILTGVASYHEQTGQPAQDLAAVNLQINAYKPGVKLDPHLDYEFTHIADDSEYEAVESLTIIYVMDGEKELMVWPQAADQDRQSPRLIRQHPDMMIVMRGGSFEENDRVYPSLWHAVPVAKSHSAILTFDIMPAYKLTYE